MRVLILGGAGMLGHKLCQIYRDRFDTWVTLRSGYNGYASHELFDPPRMLEGVDVFSFDTIVRAMATVQPDVVINCIGVIKQLPSAQDPLISLTVNSLFPHRLANLCQAANARLIHISTDCVFSGRKGMYTEDDISDAEDLYGRTKFLGEVAGPDCLTLRTSIIGRELRTTSGLVEWFLSNRGGRVRGYTRAIYSGLTTQALAQVILNIIQDQRQLTGLYHVSTQPTSKYELLCLLNEAYQANVEIKPFSEIVLDRSLDSRRFQAATGFVPPAWPDMIHALADDPTPYTEWRDRRDV